MLSLNNPEAIGNFVINQWPWFVAGLLLLIAIPPLLIWRLILTAKKLRKTRETARETAGEVLWFMSQATENCQQATEIVLNGAGLRLADEWPGHLAFRLSEMISFLNKSMDLTSDCPYSQDRTVEQMALLKTVEQEAAATQQLIFAIRDLEVSRDIWCLLEAMRTILGQPSVDKIRRIEGVKWNGLVFGMRNVLVDYAQTCEPIRRGADESLNRAKEFVLSSRRLEQAANEVEERMKLDFDTFSKAVDSLARLVETNGLGTDDIIKPEDAAAVLAKLQQSGKEEDEAAADASATAALGTASVEKADTADAEAKAAAKASSEEAAGSGQAGGDEAAQNDAVAAMAAEENAPQ